MICPDFCYRYHKEAIKIQPTIEIIFYKEKGELYGNH